MADMLLDMLNRIAELERKQMNTVRDVRVTDRDPQKGIRVAIAEVDGKPVKSPWIQPAEHGGVLETSALPKIGQKMKLISPDGEINSNSMPVAHGHANGSTSPNRSPDEAAFRVGNAAFYIKDGAVEITAGSVKMVLSAEGLAITGGTVTHDGVNISKTHKHQDVVPGGGNTGVPV